MITSHCVTAENNLVPRGASRFSNWRALAAGDAWDEVEPRTIQDGGKTGEQNCLTTFTYKMRAFIKNIPYIVLINILLPLHNVFSEETMR